VSISALAVAGRRQASGKIHSEGLRRVRHRHCGCPARTFGRKRREKKEMSTDRISLIGANSPRISVTIAGDVATLRGTVRSWIARAAAQRAAGDTPGVRHVDNRIVVELRALGELDGADEAC
jgi:hypothetical protein